MIFKGLHLVLGQPPQPQEAMPALFDGQIILFSDVIAECSLFAAPGNAHGVNVQSNCAVARISIKSTSLMEFQERTLQA